MGKPGNTRAPLLELIDLHERAKSCDQRNWGGNAQAEPSFYGLPDRCKLSYGGRFKNMHYRMTIGFIYYYN